MKKYLSVVCLIVLAFIGNAFADGPPMFLKETMPEKEMGVMLQGLAAIQSDGALDKKTKELISLAIAAQIPCQYCVYAHTSKLTKMGASAAEMKEAIAMAGYIRMMSTILNGNNYDYDKFTQEYDQLMSAN